MALISHPSPPPDDERAAVRVLHRPVCDLLGSRYPLVFAGDGDHLAALVAAMRAGGFGLLELAGNLPARIDDAVRALRAAGDDNFAVSLATDPEADALVSPPVHAVCLPPGAGAARIERCRNAGLQVLCRIGSATEALQAQKAGAQALIAPADLLTEVLTVVNVPVLASGGIADGADVASALSLGAQGAVLRLDTAAGGQDLRTIAFAAAGLLGASLLQEPLMPPRVTLSSPVCYAEELDAAYRDALAPAPLIDALNELLEAERAGARTALALLRPLHDEELAAVVRVVHRGEVQWCGVLMAAIHRLGGSPSTRTGDFFSKVMALPDLPARLALLNRGQAWVARKLEALLPQVDDDTLRKALGEMLAAHRENIDRVEKVLA